MSAVERTPAQEQAFYEKVQAEIAKYPDRRSAILNALRLAQEEHGWLSPAAFEEVSRAIDLPAAQCQSIASFYDMFFLAPKGTHTVEVCTNVSCALVGAGRVVEAFEQALGVHLGETTADGTVTLRSVECLGGCGWGPVVSIDERYHEHFGEADVPGVVRRLTGEEA